MSEAGKSKIKALAERIKQKQQVTDEQEAIRSEMRARTAQAGAPELVPDHAGPAASRDLAPASASEPSKVRAR